MDNYKPNSHKYKEEQKKEKKNIQPVVKGATTKKKNGVRKLTDSIISEDISNVKNYVFMDILIPAAKKAISDIVSNGIDMILYGEPRSNKKRSSGNFVSYDKYSDRYRDRDRDRYSYGSRARAGHSFDDIVYDSRGEAEKVLDSMDELIDSYDMVSIADMCELAGVDFEHTDNNYGWTSLRTAEVIKVRDGYIIKLPRAVPLK